jgi:hypothetical protein
VRFAHAALILALLAITSSASAVPRPRHFEPDDLELEDPGTLDFDFQLGPLHGDSDGKNRVLLPDFEIGLGLMPNVQLEIDGAFSLDEFDGTHRHLSADPLWVATKLGIYDVKDDADDIWAVGIELGPRFPTIDSAGIGYGAVGLLGFTHRGLQLVVNAGTLIDPGPTQGAHSESVVLGLDLNAELDHRKKWSLQSELGGAYYLSSDPHEIAVTLGATYAVTPKLDVYLTALAGFLPNTDRAGLLLGVSPQVDLW